MSRDLAFTMLLTGVFMICGGFAVVIALGEVGIGFEALLFSLGGGLTAGSILSINRSTDEQLAAAASASQAPTV